MSLEPASAADVATVSRQLGRPARDVVGIAARCVCGAPTVVSTKPRLTDGTPFPTFYYLTHPAATAAVSTLEAEGEMPGMAAMLVDEVADEYRAAHESYIADREAFGVVEEISGISAGGMPDRVKCLHALVGHALAAGPGVNPIGDLALERAAWSPTVCECIPLAEAPSVAEAAPLAEAPSVAEAAPVAEALEASEQ